MNKSIYNNRVFIIAEVGQAHDGSLGILHSYIDDIVEGVIRASDDIAQPNPKWSSDRPDPATSNAPYRIFNIGNNAPVKLSEYIKAIEDKLGKKAFKEMLPLQAGDVSDTYADVNELVRHVSYKPATSIKKGVANFVDWFKSYYI